MRDPKLMLKPSDWNPQRVLVTGYFDGATTGIIDLGDSSGIFCLEEVAFDSDRETRVVCLSAVPRHLFEPIVDALSSVFGPPKWPFWVPIWQFDDENVRRNIESQLDALCEGVAVTLVVLTDDSLERCLAVRTVDGYMPSAATDWLQLFCMT
jgi:hypothetical protein